MTVNQEALQRHAAEMFELLVRIDLKVNGLLAALDHGAKLSDAAWEEHEASLAAIVPLLDRIRSESNQVRS